MLYEARLLANALLTGKPTTTFALDTLGKMAVAAVVAILAAMVVAEWWRQCSWRRWQQAKATPPLRKPTPMALGNRGGQHRLQ